MSSQLFSSISMDPEKSPGFENCLGGYHRVCLEKPYRLDHVSQSFCELLGYSAEELLARFGEKYELTACESDRDKFLRFLDALTAAEQTLTLQYKVQKKDGAIFPVHTSATSCRAGDGKMYGFFVTSDVSYIESDPLGERISSLIPYGFLQCTCERYPKMTHINQAMRDYLYIGTSEEMARYEQTTRENIYLALPFEEHERFQSYLESAMLASRPIQIEHKMFRSDGSRISLVGWLSVIHGDNGNNEFAVLYRQANEPIETVPIQNTSYFSVLKRSYNAILELNLDTAMVSCLHGLSETPVGNLSDIQMTSESAKHFLLSNYIFSEDRDMMTAYLDQVSDPNDDWNGRSVLQAEFRLKTPNNLFRILSVAVHLDDTQVLLCCRDITQPAYFSAQALESETLHLLYHWMDFLSSSKEGYLGMLMLDKDAEGCSLLYGSSSVLHYLGLDTEESSHRSTRPSLQECLDAACITQSDFDEMVSSKKNLYLWSRSAAEEFQFQLICHTYTHGDRTLYVIWCDSNILPKTGSSTLRVFARTFGHFDLFVDNTPITFSSSKEKELMALLIDRNGGTLSPTEAIAYLWEDEPADERTSARYRKLAMGLKRTLEKYGIENILINHNGVRSIDTTAIRCDYYELLAGNAKYRTMFHNAYMTDYSWGEETLATLWNYADTPS